MYNTFTKTLFQKRFVTLWWFLGMLFMAAVTMSVYDSFKEQNLEELMESLPPAIQKLAGDLSVLKTMEGFVSQQLYAQRIPLLSIILGIAMYSGLTAGDEQKGLLETQLSLPISRTALLLQKLAAGFVVLTIASAGAMAAILAIVPILQETLSFTLLLRYALNCLLLSLTFGLVAFAIGAATGRKGLTVGLASAFAFLSYLINSLAPSVSLLEPLDRLTPFHYYQNSDFQISNMMVLAGVSLALVITGIIAFNRRDIRSH